MAYCAAYTIPVGGLAQKQLNMSRKNGPTAAGGLNCTKQHWMCANVNKHTKRLLRRCPKRAYRKKKEGHKQTQSSSTSVGRKVLWAVRFTERTINTENRPSGRINLFSLRFLGPDWGDFWTTKKKLSEVGFIWFGRKRSVDHVWNVLPLHYPEGECNSRRSLIN